MADKGAEFPRPRRRQPQAVRLNEPVSRRRALGILGGGILTAIGFAVRNHNQSTESQPKPQAQPEVQQPPVEKREDLARNKLNKLLSTSLKDPQRKTLEKEFTLWATNLEEVELGLKSVVDPNSRIALIEKSYSLRTAENPRHLTLNSQQEDWANSENIYSETLAMSKDARVIALRILKELIKERGISTFRPDIADKVKKGELDKSFLDELAKNPELMLLSEGGMARLAVTESGHGLPRPDKTPLSKAMDKIRGLGHDWIRYGFANIGTKPAMEMTVDAAGQPKTLNDKAVEALARILSEQTGLKFHAQNIPGSERDANSSTGGALGLQIMPARALSMLENLKKYMVEGDPLLHPLDPVGAMVMAYIYIAQGVATKEGFQYGYIKPPLQVRGQDISGRVNFDAIRSWNADARQISQILESDRNFIQAFGRQ